MKKTLGFALLVCIALSACQQNTNKKQDAWKEVVNDNLTKMMGKKLILPSEGTVYNTDTESGRSYDIKDYQIVTYVDATCGACLKDLEFWNAFTKEIKEKKISVELKMFVYSNDFKEFQDSVVTSLHLTYPWISDRKAEFPTVNRIPDKKFQTALLNNKNEVVLVGYPVTNLAMRKLYIKTLTELAEK